MKDFSGLKQGSLVRHRSGGHAYVVHSHYGDRVTAARTVDLTNPSEWDHVREDGSIIADYDNLSISLFSQSGGQIIEALLKDPSHEDK